MSTDAAVDPVVRWLPTDWAHPVHVPVGTHHHLRPVRASDVDLDLPAVTGSRERLWSIYGRAWGWPPAGLTREQIELDYVTLTSIGRRLSDDAARNARSLLHGGAHHAGRLTGKGLRALRRWKQQRDGE